jgi:hypothetical protein
MERILLVWAFAKNEEEASSGGVFLVSHFFLHVVFWSGISIDDREESIAPW